MNFIFSPKTIFSSPVTGSIAGFLILLLLGIPPIFWRLGEGPIYRSMEGRECLVIQEMVRSNEWVLPLRNGEDVPHKPPLMHWIGALTAKVRGDGVDEWTVRFPSAAASLASLLLLFQMARREREGDYALVAALVLLTCESFTRQARDAWVDATLSFCILSAIYFFRRMEREGVWCGWRSYAFYSSIGLAVLSKGPIGAILPAMAIAAYLAATGRRHVLVHLVRPGAMALGVAIPLSWYAAAWTKGGELFLTTHLIRENLLHFFRGQEGARPFYFFIPALIHEAAPWSLLFPFAAWRAWKARCEPTVETLGLWWWLTAFVFFSLSAGKRRVYLLPTMPAIALMTARWLSGLRPWQPMAKKTRIGLAALISAAAFVAFAWLWGVLNGWLPGIEFIRLFGEAAWRSFFQTLADATARYPKLLATGAAGLGLGSGLVVLCLGSGRPRLAVWAALLFLCFYTSLVKPLARDSYRFQRTVKSFALQTAKIVGERPLNYFRTGEIPQAFFYLDRNVPAAPCQYDPRALAGCPPGYYFLDTRVWEELSEEQRGKASLVLRSAGLDGEVKREDLVLVEVP